VLLPVNDTQASKIYKFLVSQELNILSKERKQQTLNIKPQSTETVGPDRKQSSTYVKHGPSENRETLDHDGTEDNAPLPVPKEESKRGIKRELEDVADDMPASKVSRTSASPSKISSPARPASKTRSATSNKKASPKKAVSNGSGSQKITSFFKK